MLLRNKLSFIIFYLNVYFKMAASIGSHFENIKSQYLQNISMQFASKCAVFQILLDKIHLYFCDPFPFNCFDRVFRFEDGQSLKS